jgi:putative transposase
MIDHSHDLLIARQAEALNISRGSVSYKPRPVQAVQTNRASSIRRQLLQISQGVAQNGLNGGRVMHKYAT